jgi:hypothetical protein
MVSVCRRTDRKRCVRGRSLGATSDSFDENILRMDRERLEVLRVGGQDGSARFRDRDDKCINGRSSTRKASQQGRAPGHRFRDHLRDVARLQKPIFIRIAARVSLETFDKDHRWYFRWPQTLLTKGQN